MVNNPRFATFSLGVLQALAKNGWLGRFEHLSTVSGGGYIGSWLTRWKHQFGLHQGIRGLQESATSEPLIVKIRGRTSSTELWSDAQGNRKLATNPEEIQELCGTYERTSGQHPEALEPPERCAVPGRREHPDGSIADVGPLADAGARRCRLAVESTR